MKKDSLYYVRHRFPVEVISHRVWLYYRFSLSYRDVEELLAKRGDVVTYENMRAWSQKFGRAFAKRLHHRAGRAGDQWFLDELFVRITLSRSIRPAGP